MSAGDHDREQGASTPPTGRKRNPPPDPRLSAKAMRVQMAGMGLEFVSLVIGGIVLGSFIDDRFDTGPIFLLVGAFGSLIGSMYRLVQLSQRLDRLRQAEERRNRGGG